MNKAIIPVLGALLSCTGCMTEREYMLRKQQTETLGAHPKTYEVVTLTGPLELKEGSRITASSPTQPLRLPPVPDGQAVQQTIIRDTVTGAIIGYGINRAAAGGSRTTTNTTTTSGGTNP